MSQIKPSSSTRKSGALRAAHGIGSSWLVLGVASLVGFALNLRKIQLFTADLGRHIANGREILRSLAVLSSNYYSYTFPDFPFVNHHWGSGLLFHIVHESLGFEGLSILHSGMIAAAVLVLGIIVCRRSHGLLASLIFGLCLPLAVSRTEVRPEAFSYLFVALCYAVLWRWREDEISRRWLWLLPFIIMLWVNLHIYFFLGFVIFAVFSADKLYSLRHDPTALKSELKFLALISGAMTTASLLNPLGWQIAIYPARIFDNYGYMIAENQSIPFFWRHPMQITEFVPYHALAITMLIGIALVLWHKRDAWTRAPIILGALGALLGCLAIRNFGICGLLALPALTAVFQYCRNTKVYRPLIVLATIAFAIALPSYASRVSPILKHSFGPGLAPGMDNAMRFFRNNGLKGPILNNYDIGGYLIFYLFPDEKVFVDNRPEAYPREFFENIYVPLQENDMVFAQATQRFGFNTIFFYRHDNTPAGQRFLISRIQDESWVPVFVDDYALIMVRNDSANQEIIRQFALPKSMFRVSS